jgi:RNA polymerase sigma-70 factor (ECF subfamily)
LAEQSLETMQNPCQSCAEAPNVTLELFSSFTRQIPWYIERRRGIRQDGGDPLCCGHEQTDLALVEAARVDREAFGELYARHVDRVFAYAISRLRQPELAEDATAVAFIRALNGLDRFKADPTSAEADSAFTRWLMTITRNTVIDVVRQRRDVVALDMLALARMRSAVRDDPAMHLPVDDCQRIEQAIDDLGSPQREIVVLRLQGWKGVEIAELLGIIPGAVRVAQHRAYRRLRATLEDLHPQRRKPANGAST